MASRSALLRLIPIVGLLAMLPVLATAFGKPASVSFDELVRRDGVFLDAETLEPYTGSAFESFVADSSLVARRVSMRDGKYDGPYQRYYESGRLFEEGTYRMGRREGPYTAYWEGVDLYERGTYKEGAYDGPRSWYLNGRLVERATYVAGTLEGPYERYDSAGTLVLRGSFRAGAPCGAWFELDQPLDHPPCADAERR